MQVRISFLRLVIASLVLSLFLACGGNSTSSDELGFKVPSACRVILHDTTGPGGLEMWTFTCDDSEHVFMPDEERPLFENALNEAGWTACGAAAGTAFYRKGDRIVTLAFAANDRRLATFGQVYVGQKARTDEC